MGRHKKSVNRPVMPDEKYNSPVITKFVTRMMLDGKKQTCQRVVYDALEKLKGNYDYILIDCPPSLNTLSLMALTASTDVIIPVQAQYLPLKGVALIRDTINLMQEHFNPELKIAGVLLTFYNERRNLDKDVLEVLQQAFGNKLFKTMISTNTKLAEAPSHGKDIIEYSPRSKGAKQYKALALEISEQ